MQKSRELKELLTQACSAEVIRNAVGFWLDSDTAGPILAPKAVSRLGQEQVNIDAVDSLARELEERQIELSDENFASDFRVLRSEVESIERFIARGEPKREMVTEFVDMRRAIGYDQFCKDIPMYWMPRREEVARILALAVNLHDQRVEKGEKSLSDPIEIVDVGGGNGALCYLISQMASTNQLNVRCRVVDPDTVTVLAAQQHYAGIGPISFINQSAKDYVDGMYQDGELGRKLVNRNALVALNQERLDEFDLLTRNIERWESLNQESNGKLMMVLEQDFGLTKVAEQSLAELRESLLQTMQFEVRKLTEDFELELALQPASVDLVINAWMPAHMDFSKEVRAINGAGLIYILETYGCSGIQPESPHPSYPSKVGQEATYLNNDIYRSVCGWVGPSVPQLRQGVIFEEQGWTYPYQNSFLVQQRFGYSAEIESDVASLSLGEPYPWEADLIAHIPDVAPPIEIKQASQACWELVGQSRDLAEYYAAKRFG